MPFKNPNEKNYVYGKKHWTDVIKNSGPSDCVIWKQPEEDFNTSSTLIVNPGESAIFIKDGEIVEIFSSGKYELTTENYPFISRLKNLFSGGISTFNCFVYFVKTTDLLNIKWGTDSPIRIRDKKWNVLVDVRARGVVKARIDDPELLLGKLIGNNALFETQDSLIKYFQGEFSSIIRPIICNKLDNYNDELVSLDNITSNLSKDITPELNKSTIDYGVECIQFNLIALDIDKSKYDEIDKSQIDRISMQRDAEGKKDVQNILGDSWERQQSVDILKSAASNGNTSGLITAIGMNTGINGMGNIANEMSSSHSTSSVDRLREAKKLLEEELINEEEYKQIKERILNNI